MQFYRELNQEEERCDDDQPVTEESKQFWGNIWSLQIIRRMQSGYKTCEVNLMLKNSRRYNVYLLLFFNIKFTSQVHRKFEKDTW